jgi:hypothetical protein
MFPQKEGHLEKRENPYFFVVKGRLKQGLRQRYTDVT